MDMISKINLKREYVFFLQIIFVLCVIFASQDFKLANPFDHGALMSIARFIVYLMVINGSEGAVPLIYSVFQTHNLSRVKQNIAKRAKSISVFTGACVVLLYYGEMIRGPDFGLLALASLAVKYPDLVSCTAHISYGTGMACSFFEGYLVNVIPPDGSNFEGVQGAIKTYENREQVIFPVRRLFLIITKSLHCPPDLAMLNREHRGDLPRLEACKSLEDIQKDVAGVKSRIYRNSAYKILRGNNKRLVYLAAECASPLHTLYKVKTRKQLYQELLNADFDQIRDDFCEMLKTILDSSPDCRGKVEFIEYDDKDESQNLADILLKRIEELEPNFENLTREG